MSLKKSEYCNSTHEKHNGPQSPSFSQSDHPDAYRSSKLTEREREIERTVAGSVWILVLLQCSY